MATDQQHPRLDRLMVTRPAAEAGRWVGALSDAGWPAQALPLISIGGPRSPEALLMLERARAHWAQWDALMFVSSAAVAHFFAGRCAPPAVGVVRTRFWAPGPGTRRALIEALQNLGLSAEAIDAPPADAVQFDSEALWPVVQDQMGPGKRLLVVRGESPGISTAPPHPQLAGHGREWLMQQCGTLGARVEACVAYERSAPEWSASLRAQAHTAAAPGSLWLLSSSEALAHLHAGLPDANWSHSAALATHPRIAEAAHEAGFGEVQISRPALPDVLRALKSHWSPP